MAARLPHLGLFLARIKCLLLSNCGGDFEKRIWKMLTSIVLEWNLFYSTLWYVSNFQHVMKAARRLNCGRFELIWKTKVAETMKKKCQNNIRTSECVCLYTDTRQKYTQFNKFCVRSHARTHSFTLYQTWPTCFKSRGLRWFFDRHCHSVLLFSCVVKLVFWGKSERKGARGRDCETKANN